MNIVCTHIVTMFNNLICLKFHPYSDIYVAREERLSFSLSEPPIFFSSSLMELHINVEDFTDCLYLLDGRFKQLHTFYVDVHWFPPPSPVIINKEELIHLKCFSLTCDLKMLFYEESVVPLLHRMSNIEQLSLYIIIDRLYDPYNSFVDGDNLKKDIICHMPKLKNFVFSIHSIINHLDFSINLPSNQDIQRTFKDLEDYQIVSYIDYFPNEKSGRCHIYSCPSQMRYYYKLANSFPGGLFKSVRHVFLYDEHPFEFEFFIRIAQACPFLKTLVMENESPQNYEQFKKSNVDNRNLPIIKYPHLTLLNLLCAHNDYIEQFLDNTKTCLSNNIHLVVDYNSLQTVTYNFTRNTTRVNCVNIRLDKIASDPIFTENLTLMKRSSNGVIKLLDDSIFDRFYSQILPKIHHKIKWLDLEPLSMERILLAVDYPNLHGLSLFNIERELGVRLFGEESHLDRIFKNQITTLNITLAENNIIASTSDIMNIVCTHILTMFNNLICLKFHPYSDIHVASDERLSFSLKEPPTFFSSSLMELHINVEDFTDCLYLLDGRFKQLHTFYVNVHVFFSPTQAIINKVPGLETGLIFMAQPGPTRPS
ncbi:unnamed protein product [Rotaria sp. Silwood2]|nr:unnamed protein product [Rotaria sp. Silwood2]